MPTERKRRDRRKTNGEYDVGYGKPPKEHRFPPGRSGNPAGGRKKPRNFDSSRLGDLVDKEASRKVVLSGEEMTAEQALIRSMFVNGIKGKVTSQRMALKYREERENAAQRDTIRAITTPTLIIVRANDPRDHTCGELIHATIATSRTEYLQAAHISNVEQPARFTQSVSDFLAAPDP